MKELLEYLHRDLIRCLPNIICSFHMLLNLPSKIEVRAINRGYQLN